jgi:hypothetical protein
MTVVRTFRPENRLAKAVDRPGGATVADAISRATEQLEAVRAECMSALDEKIASIEALTSNPTFSSSGEDIRRVYDLANEILNEAGVFALVELSEAGRSLCDLTGGARKEAALDVRAIHVHVAAMKSLRRPEVHGDAATRAAVLEGLRQVTAKVSAKVAEA